MKRRQLKTFLGVVLFISGTGILYFVLSPIIIYNLSSARLNGYLSPIPENATDLDYTKPQNWFPAAQGSFSESKVTHYTLSIPKLKIEGATVAIGGEDLADSLIQYPGTALPGKIGNAVIFGHSILPQFYDPEDYMAIFSTLPTLKIGDEIQVRYDGINYAYKVQDMFEVRPEDIQVLDQNDDDSYVTLITCTPPGHPFKPRRLVVRAKIVPPNEAISQANIRN